jgi:glycosyltransferase involved in cell wall biosynthesis
MNSAVGPPLIPEVGLLALPYHHWGTRWMTPHHVLTRLARYFRIVWIEPAHQWRDALSIDERHASAGLTPQPLPEGFGIYVPEPWLPDVYRPASLRRMLLRSRVERGWQRLQAAGCRKFVLHLWHPKFETALDSGPQDLSLYHIDDEYSFSPDAPLIGQQEARVLRRVDQVFAISPGLMERKGGINPHLTFAPEGVDFRMYATPAPEPADIAPIRHPRVGYTGNLKRQLDWFLLRELARRHPQWSFVFVGPRTLSAEAEGVVDEMSRMPNVHFLGAKSVTELASYPQHFDVSIMPYVVNGYTNNIYPLKLHEYLACGRPVVGAPIRSLKDFAHAIALASSAEEWSVALAAALEPPVASQAGAAARQAIARQYDWSEIIFNIAATICDRLGPDYVRRLKRIDFGTLPPTPTLPNKG